MFGLSKEMLSTNMDGYDHFFKRMDTEDELIDRYNKIADKSSGIHAVATLSNVRIEVTREFEHLTNRIEKFVESVQKYTATNDNDDYPKQSLSETIQISLNHTFPTSGQFPEYATDKDKLKRYIKEFSELTGNQAITRWMDGINQAYSDREILEDLEIQKDAVEKVIRLSITKHYPDKLEKETHSYTKEDGNKVSPGRPLDKRLDQKLIEKEVRILIEKAQAGQEGFQRFIHQKGKYKNMPNKNQIKKKLLGEGLPDDVTEKTILNRIDMALETIGNN